LTVILETTLKAVNCTGTDKKNSQQPREKISAKKTKLGQTNTSEEKHARTEHLQQKSTPMSTWPSLPVRTAQL